MRTTVTLDADVERLIREAMARGQTSFKRVLNEAVRRGLRQSDDGAPEPFEVRAKPMRLRVGIDPARLHDADDELEILEFVRKTTALEALKT